MEITVSLTGSRNLSASALIARNLFSTLQVGATTYQGSPIDVAEAAFTVPAADSQLVITLKNGMTQTVMHARSVPLSFVVDAQRQVGSWIEVYPPGDARNSQFDAAAPRPDVPQIYLSVRCSATALRPSERPSALEQPWPAERPSLLLQQRPAERPSMLLQQRPAERPSALQQPPPPPPSERPSLLQRESLGPGVESEPGLRRTYEQMEDIRAKVSALADGKRQAESGEYQLQIVQQELEEARSGIEQAELELYRLKTARAAAEKEKQDAQEAVNRARDTLRQHEQSIVELRLSCEEAERKLAQVSTDCSQQQAAMDTSMSNFDREMKTMAEELARWKAEAANLSGSLEECERRMQELQANGDIDCTKVCLPDEGEEVQALRSQLDKTSVDLELVRKSALDQAAKLDEAEQECQSAVARLADAEAAAEDAREDQRQKAAELRSEADAAERELIACMSRVAALEGQVGENRNQLREMGGHVEDLVVRVNSSTDTLRDTGFAVSHLKESFAAHELELTCKAIDEDRQDLDSQLAATRKRQEQLRAEAASADEEADALVREEREVSLNAEGELQASEAETDRREKQRLELVGQLSALEEELVEARRQFCAADAEASTARAAVATAVAEAEQRELGLEEAVELLRSELGEQRREVEALEANQQSSATELDQTIGLLPTKQAEAERLRLARTAALREREQLEAEMAEVRRRLTEQDAKAAELSQRAAEYQEQISAAHEEAEEVGKRQAEVLSLFDAVVSQRRKQEEECDEVARADSERSSAERGLDALRFRRERLTEEMEELQSIAMETAGRLAEVSSDTQATESSHAERIAALEADRQKCEAQQAGLDSEAEQLEEQLKAFEAQLAEELGVQSAMDETVSMQRGEVVSVGQEMQLCDEELKARRTAMASQTEALSEVRERTTVLESRAGQLRTELSSAEADEQLADALRAECDAEEAAGQQARGQDPEFEGLKRTGSGSFAGQAALFDRQIDQIDDLERDILSLTGNVEERVVTNESLEQQLGSTDSEVMEAMERRADQLARVLVVRGTAARLEEDIRAKQESGDSGGLAGCSKEDLAAEEQKVELLKEQLASRREAIAEAEAERREVKALAEGLEVELQQLQEEQGALADKLSYQVELGSLQDTTIERLQEEIQKIEGETEVLTLGLHDAEQRSDVLQKENQLMRQQLEGMYNGSLHDWAAEVDRIKGDGEVQRSTDELNHWMQVAQEAEQELENEVKVLSEQHAQAEQALQETLKTLEAELEQWQEMLKESGLQKDQKSGGAVHSVPAALHGFVQPVRSPPPQVKQRALLVGCNYARTHAPLRGCANDAWNMQCLLRHSLRYVDDQVRTLIDLSDACPSPERRQPTKANILSGLQWLVADAGPADNLLIYMSGYGTQQPRSNDPSNFEAFFVPCDFADDLPTDFFSRLADDQSKLPGGVGYRLVPLAEISRALAFLPAGCKATVVLDCCHGLPPGVDAQRPAPVVAPWAALEEARYARDEVVCSQARFLDLPPLPTPPTLLLSGPLACCCHCYSACQTEQWCVELMIEGCVQGAFTWAFVKALIAGHLDTSVSRHCKALDRILLDLQMKFGWIDQTPALQLSSSAKAEDLVLLSDIPSGAKV